jgi:hypothetical protein
VRIQARLIAWVWFDQRIDQCMLSLRGQPLS